MGPHVIHRRKPGPDEILIEILYSGICHSDIHTARSEWGPTQYPCVPGHEIVGKVVEVGKRVKRFKVGDHAGVGCFVDSCGKCKECKSDEEQYCTVHAAFTYNSLERDLKTPTFGGYSERITVRERYALKIKKNLPLEKVAPLLCAGITTYSPLKRHGIKKGMKVGIVGLGGLGHMGLKLARAMGAEVTVFSTSPAKEKDAKKMGAKHFLLSNKPGAFDAVQGNFDFILDTVSAKHDFTPYLEALKKDGTLVLVGAAPDPSEVHAFSLIFGRKKLTGSLIGGIRETQEMLDFCAKKGVVSEVEVIPASQINEAYERTLKGDVRYRFVIDTSSLGPSE